MKRYLVLETFCKLKASYLPVFHDLFSTRTRRQTSCDTKGEGRQFYKLYACLSLQFLLPFGFCYNFLLLPTILQKLPYKVKSSCFKRIFQGWSNTPELNTAPYTSSLDTCNHYWLSIRRWLTQGLRVITTAAVAAWLIIWGAVPENKKVQKGCTPTCSFPYFQMHWNVVPLGLVLAKQIVNPCSKLLPCAFNHKVQVITHYHEFHKYHRKHLT